MSRLTCMTTVDKEWAVGLLISITKFAALLFMCSAASEGKGCEPFSLQWGCVKQSVSWWK